MKATNDRGQLSNNSRKPTQESVLPVPGSPWHPRGPDSGRSIILARRGSVREERLFLPNTYTMYNSRKKMRCSAPLGTMIGTKLGEELQKYDQCSQMTLLCKQTLGQDTALSLMLVCVGSKNNRALTDATINVEMETWAHIPVHLCPAGMEQALCFMNEEVALRNAGSSGSNSYWHSDYVSFPVALAFLALGH